MNSIRRRIELLERQRARPGPRPENSRIWTDEEIMDRYGDVIRKMAGAHPPAEEHLPDGTEFLERIRRYRAAGYCGRF